MMKIRMMQYLLIITALVCLTSNTHGQLIRNFPINSKLGELTEFKFPEVEISDQTMYLGAGGQIRDINNLLVFPAMLDKIGPVRYQLDTTGNVHRIWFLTPEEADLAKQHEESRKSK